MANVAGPRGFVPSRYLDGSAWNGQTNMYFIPSTDGNQYNVGDAVKSAANADTNGIPAIAKITNGTDTIRGVIVGVLVANPNSPSFQGINLDLTIQNIPATKLKNYYVLVCDDPNLLYEIQDDGITTANLVAANANKNCSFTVTNPTSPQQNSATVLLSSSFATTAGLPLKLMGLVQKPNNSFGAFATWLVRINQHEFQGNTAGV